MTRSIMDLYTLLGVTRAASAGEIERAYRRLARRYHPGVNPGDRVAEEMYRQIQRRLRRARRSPSGAASTTAARGERRRPCVEATVVVRGVRFLGAGRGPARGDVLGALRRRLSGRRARGDDADARRATSKSTLRLSFEDAMRGGDVSAVRRASGALRDVRRRRARAAAAGRRARRAAAAARGAGRAATWCSPSRATRATGSGPADRAAVPRRARGVGVAPRSEVVTVDRAAGHRVRRAGRRARPRPRRRARRAGGRSLRDDRRRRRIRSSGARGAICT